MRKEPLRFKRFNKDSLRNAIGGGSKVPEDEKFIRDIIYHGVELALHRKYDIILDNTNFNDKDFYGICEIAERVGNVRVLEKYFEITLKEAIYNNGRRPQEEMIPFHIIENMYKKHVKGKKVPIRDLYFEPRIQPYRFEDDHRPRAIIVDLDGTLAVATDRDYYDMENVNKDKLNEYVYETIYALRLYMRNLNVIFVSGRHGMALDGTQQWLSDLDIRHDHLFMREEDDHRPDAVIKEEIYKKYIEPKYNVFLVLDDRNSVVNMWRKLGLTCFQVAHGFLS